MIEFRNGEFKSGDTLGIVEYDFNDFSKDDLWLNPLTEDCWIFVIPKDDSEVGLFNASEGEVDFLPKEQDTANEYYELFWNSELTILFSSYKQALEYMREYQGPLLDVVRGYYLLHVRDNLTAEAMDGYTRINDLDSLVDTHFYTRLTRFVMSEPLDPETAITTMKSFILDYYRFELAEQRFNN